MEVSRERNVHRRMSIDELDVRGMCVNAKEVDVIFLDG